VTRALLTDTPLTVLPGFDAGAIERLGRDGQATHVSLVATGLRRIDPASFTCILLGGSRPPEGLAPNVVATYGMTETGSGVVYDGVPLDGAEIALAHFEEDREEGGDPPARAHAHALLPATGPTGASSDRTGRAPGSPPVTPAP